MTKSCFFYFVNSSPLKLHKCTLSFLAHGAMKLFAIAYNNNASNGGIIAVRWCTAYQCKGNPDFGDEWIFAK